MMFARGEVSKSYLAVAQGNPSLELPTVLRSRIMKYRGRLQAVEESGDLNAETLVETLGDQRYRLIPRTGRTHQLRVHMSSIGVPILGDPLYPDIIDGAAEDFSTPLQLLAHTLEFEDPLSGAHRRFVSTRTLG
jgi:tRNA pseudouridine32 synthase/23S rRNA pseudouridine746 synthase